jgi:hypothetical protein
MDVPVDFQDIVQRILEYGKVDETPTDTADPASVSAQNSTGSLEDIRKNESPLDDDNIDIFGSTSHIASKFGGGQLHIRTFKFYTVNSTLMFLKVLYEYIQYMIHIPVMATDLLHKMSELLKVIELSAPTLQGSNVTKRSSIRNFASSF